jgi:putative ABC transport system substrate-binding protein
MERLIIRIGLVGLLAVAIAACPSLATAQNINASLKRVGYLSGFGCFSSNNAIAFRRRLAELGWIDGQKLIFDCVSTVNPDQVGALAAELVARRPDVLLAADVPSVRALKQATMTIPIVMWSTQAPVEVGLVTNLARPEANITGLSVPGAETTAKRLEMLKELLPRLAKVALVTRQGSDPTFESILKKSASEGATKLGFAWQGFAAGIPEDYDAIFSQLEAEGFDAAYVTSNPLSSANLSRIVALGIQHRIPTVGDNAVLAEKGLLFAYRDDGVSSSERVAEYVDKLLRGAKPGDLPIEFPTKFNLVVNLKTAKLLGLVIPESFLLRADRVIE